MGDYPEFIDLRNKMQQKSYIRTVIRKPGLGGYFRSGIHEGFKYSDVVLFNTKDHFVLEFNDEEQLIIIEKNW